MSGTNNINSAQLQNIVAQQQYVPDEGPKAIPVLLNFGTLPDGTQPDTFIIDLTLVQQQNRMAMVQTVFIDMTQSANPFVITAQGSGQQIKVKPGTQGYYSLLAPNPVRLSCQGVANSGDVVPIILYNVAIPGVVWSTT